MGIISIIILGYIGSLVLALALEAISFFYFLVHDHGIIMSHDNLD